MAKAIKGWKLEVSYGQGFETKGLSENKDKLIKEANKIVKRCGYVSAWRVKAARIPEALKAQMI